MIITTHSVHLGGAVGNRYGGQERDAVCGHDSSREGTSLRAACRRRRHR